MYIQAAVGYNGDQEDPAARWEMVTVTKAELDNLRRVEDAILVAVAAAGQPYPPRELYQKLEDQGHSEDLARAAIWFLVDAGRLYFTPNRWLTLQPMVAAPVHG